MLATARDVFYLILHGQVSISYCCLYPMTGMHRLQTVALRAGQQLQVVIFSMQSYPLVASFYTTVRVGSTAYRVSKLGVSRLA